jgi:uncharacterized protein HemX
MSNCPTETDTVLLLTEAFDPSELDGCHIPENFTFRIPYNEAKMPDETPEHYAPASPSAPVEPAPVEPAPVEPVAEAPSANALSSLSEAPPVADLSGLKDMAGDNSVLMVILALVAVLGGGTAWKFYQQNANQKHEQAMRKLDLEAKAMKVQSTSPPACQQAHAKMEAEISDIGKRVSDHASAVEERLAKVERRTLSLTGSGVDLEELDQRVAKVEKAVKPRAKK